jgi:hypothetical protein
MSREIPDWEGARTLRMGMENVHNEGWSECLMVLSRSIVTAVGRRK